MVTAVRFGTTLACNTTAMQLCLGADLTLPGLGQQHINDSVFPVYDDGTLDAMCRSASSSSLAYCQHCCNMSYKCSFKCSTIKCALWADANPRRLERQSCCGWHHPMGQPLYEVSRKCHFTLSFNSALCK